MAGRAAAEELLAGAGVRSPIRKAFDLSSGRGFDRAAGELAARLGGATAPLEAEAVRAAVAGIDVDWGSTSAEDRRRLLAAAAERARVALRRTAQPIEATLGGAAEEVVTAARLDVRRQGLSIGADFNAVDERLLTYLRTSETLFVGDEHDRRARSFSRRAQAAISNGLAEGLGNADLADAVRREATGAFEARSARYWEMVAASFVGRGRSFAQLSGYAEAGIERYRIEAVLDEATTEVCRFLHGKVFSVGRGLTRFTRAEQSPASVKSIAPWVRVGRDTESGRSVLYINKAGERVPIAEVTRSGVGSTDDVGEFRLPSRDQDLMDLGLGFPPYHGLCRTTTLAVV